MTPEQLRHWQAVLDSIHPAYGADVRFPVQCDVLLAADTILQAARRYREAWGVFDEAMEWRLEDGPPTPNITRAMMARKEARRALFEALGTEG